MVLLTVILMSWNRISNCRSVLIVIIRGPPDSYKSIIEKSLPVVVLRLLNTGIWVRDLFIALLHNIAFNHAAYTTTKSATRER